MSKLQEYEGESSYKTLTNGEITNIQKFHLILIQNDLKMTATFIYDAFEARRVSMEVAGVLESTISKVGSGRPK